MDDWNLSRLLDVSAEDRPVDYWDKVRARILSHTDELLAPGFYTSNATTAVIEPYRHYTAFQRMCGREDFPVDLIKLAIKEHPDIVKKLSRDYTPHPFLVACAFVNENTIEALLEVYPKAAAVPAPDEMGYPLVLLYVGMCHKHVKIRGRLSPPRGDLLIQMLDVHPLLKMSDFAVLVRFMSSAWDYVSQQQQSAVIPSHNAATVGDAFFKSLIQVIEHRCGSGSDNGHNDNLPLHFILANKGIVSVLLEFRGQMECIIEYYKDHLLKQNDQGETPLYIFVKHGEKGDDKQQQQSVLSNFLKQAPSAAGVPNYNGRLPFYEALRRKGTGLCHWSGSLRMLYDAEQDAIRTRDVASGMYPFMEAAAVGEETSTTACACSDLSTIFILLQRHPETAHGLAKRGNKRFRDTEVLKLQAANEELRKPFMELERVVQTDNNCRSSDGAGKRRRL
mmetsp:Transcript_8616/g.12722  ORF Transcript_8616/g.12722 Transcript_8616/m.12722 type:complete len:449 (-) Transcript_8616:119-1465(-)